LDPIPGYDKVLVGRRNGVVELFSLSKRKEPIGVFSVVGKQPLKRKNLPISLEFLEYEGRKFALGCTAYGMCEMWPLDRFFYRDGSDCKIKTEDFSTPKENARFDENYCSFSLTGPLTSTSVNHHLLSGDVGGNINSSGALLMASVGKNDLLRVWNVHGTGNCRILFEGGTENGNSSFEEMGGGVEWRCVFSKENTDNNGTGWLSIPSFGAKEKHYKRRELWPNQYRPKKSM
jgi:hypothetical protein